MRELKLLNEYYRLDKSDRSISIVSYDEMYRVFYENFDDPDSPIIAMDHGQTIQLPFAYYSINLGSLKELG